MMFIRLIYSSLFAAPFFLASWIGNGFAQPAANPIVTEENGLEVQVFEDGQAVVLRDEANILDYWRIDCRIDPMTDKRPCHFHSGRNGIVVYYELSDTPVGVCIVDHDFPGKSGMLRVDKHEAITSNKNVCVKAELILDQLKSGETILTRRYKFPKKSRDDNRTSLIGFNKAMEIVDRIRSQ